MDHNDIRKSVAAATSGKIAPAAPQKTRRDIDWNEAAASFEQLHNSKLQQQADLTTIRDAMSLLVSLVPSIVDDSHKDTVAAALTASMPLLDKISGDKANEINMAQAIIVGLKAKEDPCKKMALSTHNMLLKVAEDAPSEMNVGELRQALRDMRTAKRPSPKSEEQEGQQNADKEAEDDVDKEKEISRSSKMSASNTEAKAATASIDASKEPPKQTSPLANIGEEINLHTPHKIVVSTSPSEEVTDTKVDVSSPIEAAFNDCITVASTKAKKLSEPSQMKKTSNDYLRRKKLGDLGVARPVKRKSTLAHSDAEEHTIRKKPKVAHTGQADGKVKSSKNVVTGQLVKSKSDHHKIDAEANHQKAKPSLSKAVNSAESKTIQAKDGFVNKTTKCIEGSGALDKKKNIAASSIVNTKAEMEAGNDDKISIKQDARGIKTLTGSSFQVKHNVGSDSDSTKQGNILTGSRQGAGSGAPVTSRRGKAGASTVDKK